MGNRDIQIVVRYARFRLHDVPVSVIGFGNLRFGLALRPGKYSFEVWQLFFHKKEAAH